MEGSEKLDFGFITDGQVRYLLEQYYADATKANDADSHLGAIVAYGAVAEGLLTWALLTMPDKAQKSPKAHKNKQGEVLPLEKWPLSHLIQVGKELELLGGTAAKGSWALNDFRNFIHPYNVLQQSARPDKALALNAMAALMEIVRSLKGRLHHESEI